MRIDLDSISFRPDFQPQKVSGEVHELNNRGDFVKGLVVDVNRNMVLIQSSTGKQFSAKTTIPLENFLGHEISFSILTTAEGELLLIPDIEEKKSDIIDLKIEDILTKFGKQLTKENKEIVSQMMKSGIQITKEKFDEIKNLNYSLNSIKNNNFVLNLDDEQINSSIDKLTTSLQIIKDFGKEAKEPNFTLNSNVGLKEIIFLKNLDMKVSLKNLNSFSELFKDIEQKNNDFVGLEKLINNLENELGLKKETEYINKETNNPFVNEKQLEKVDNNLLDKLSFEDMEKINKLNPENFKKDSITNELSKIIEENSKKSEKILLDLKNIDKNLEKKINEVELKKDDVRINYNKVSEELKDIIKNVDKKSDIYQRIENDILPKLEILSNMQNKYNYSIVPFSIKDNYENILQFYVKKDPEKKKYTKNQWLVGVSIDTNNYGTIKSGISMKNTSNITITFSVEKKEVSRIIDGNKKELEEIMKSLGFRDVSIKVSDKLNLDKNILIEDALFENANLKTFETWV